MKNETKNTPETVGNQFGHLCPKCGNGDQLSIQATVSVNARLCPDGTDNDGGDTEWNDESMASCGCGWSGKVKEFKQAENFEEE